MAKPCAKCRHAKTLHRRHKCRKTWQGVLVITKALAGVTKLADPSQRDEKAIKNAYKRGWSDCAAKLANRTQDAIQSLTHCHSAALAEYTSTHPRM